MDSVVSPRGEKNLRFLCLSLSKPWVTQLLCSLIRLSVSQQKVLNAVHTVALGDEKLGSALVIREPWANPQLVAKTLYKTWDFALIVCH